eukprot:364567-Chlamydomonas_euryale.AAC.6
MGGAEESARPSFAPPLAPLPCVIAVARRSAFRISARRAARRGSAQGAAGRRKRRHEPQTLGLSLVGGAGHADCSLCGMGIFSARPASSAPRPPCKRVIVDARAHHGTRSAWRERESKRDERAEMRRTGR